MKLLTMTLLLAGLAAAQTVTYDVPSGAKCIGGAAVNPVVLESCWFKNMTPEQPADGSALPPWALPYAIANFGGGIGSWKQVDFQAVPGQNTAAIYDTSGDHWVSAAMDNGHTLFTFDGTSTGASSSMAGTYTIHTVVEAYSYTETYRCGGPKGTSYSCTREDWAIVAGTVAITPVAAANIVGGPGDSRTSN